MFKLLALGFLLLPLLVAGNGLHLEQTQGPSAGAIKFGLAFSPAEPNVVYVDRFKSVNGGASWSELAVPTRFGAVRSIAVDPRDSGTVYLATNNFVFKSLDAGNTWRELSPIGPHPESEEWRGRAVSDIEIDPANSNVVYAGTTHGDFYKSTDGGATWSDKSFGISSPVSRIAISGSVVYVATGSWYWGALVNTPRTGNGLYKSTDNGESFQHIDNEFGSDLVQDVDVAGQNVYAVVTHGFDQAGEWSAVFVSRDAGSSWQRVLDTSQGPQRLTHLAVNPSNESHLVVSGTSDVPFLVSRDGGETWTRVGLQSSERVRYTHELEFSGDELYALEYYSSFLKSVDGGYSWRWSANGISTSSVYAVQVHPKNRNFVFAATGDGALHKTHDGGNTWKRTRLSVESSPIADIEFHPRDSNKFFLGITSAHELSTGRYYGAPWRDTGLYASSDDGDTWQKLSGLKHPNSDFQLEIYDVLVHPSNPDLVLVGTASQGVYRSEDGGQTWSEANNGIPKQGLYWDVNARAGTSRKTECEERYSRFQRGEQVEPGCFYYATRTSMRLFVNPHDENEFWYTTLNGVFVSRDLGESWQWLSDDLQGIHVHFMAFDPSDKNTVYLGTHQGAIVNGEVVNSSKGLLISRDGGLSWQGADGPGQGFDVRAIAVDPSNQNLVIVGTNDPLFISNDAGRTWTQLEHEGLSEADEIVIDPTAKVIYLATGQNGVWRGIIEYDENSEVVSVTGASFPRTVSPGQEFQIIVSLDNLGGARGSRQVSLRAGDFQQNKSVDIGAADQALVVFNVSLVQSAEIFVDETSFGEVHVAGEQADQRAEAQQREEREVASEEVALEVPEPGRGIRESFSPIELISNFFKSIISFLKSLLGR